MADRLVLLTKVHHLVHIRHLFDGICCQPRLLPTPKMQQQYDRSRKHRRRIPGDGPYVSFCSDITDMDARSSGISANSQRSER